MDFRYFVTLQRFVRPGDRAVVYAHGGDFVAEVEVDGDAYEDHTPIGWTKRSRQPFLFPYRIKISVLREGRAHVSYSTTADGDRARHSFPNLIDDLTFIADKSTTWNQYVQVSIVAISKEDFDTIASRL